MRLQWTKLKIRLNFNIILLVNLILQRIDLAISRTFVKIC